MEMETGTQTIVKEVVLPVGWELDDEAGLKTYLHELYHINDDISGLFDNDNLRIITMKAKIELTVAQIESATFEELEPKDLGTIDPTPLD